MNVAHFDYIHIQNIYLNDLHIHNKRNNENRKNSIYFKNISAHIMKLYMKNN